MGSHVEIIDFSRPDGSRRNLFISGIPAALCEEVIVVGLQLTTGNVSLCERHSPNKPCLVNNVSLQ